METSQESPEVVDERLGPQLDKFHARVEAFRQHIIENRGKKEEKHLFSFFASKGVVFNQYLEECLGKMHRREECCDMFMVSLVRALFIGTDDSQEVASAKEKIEAELASFPFWPQKGQLDYSFPPDLVFWSENHTFMILSCRYLYRQRILLQAAKKMHDPAALENGNETADSLPRNALDEMQGQLLKEHETILLQSYLEAHCSAQFNHGGVYETLSHVYLPYTLSALFNLYDFSGSARIKQCAGQLIDAVVSQLLSVTTYSNGICSMSASARAYRRTRLRAHSHNLCGLMTMLIGVCPVTQDPFKASAISDCVCTTTWAPTERVYASLFISRINARRCSPDVQLAHIRKAVSSSLATGSSVQSLRTSPAEVVGHIGNAEKERVRSELVYVSSAEATEERESGAGAAAAAAKSGARSRVTQHLYPLVDEAEAVPLYWSAGLVVHPQFIAATQKYTLQKGMTHNQHLWPLRMLSQFRLQSLSTSYKLLTEGQQYTGIHLNVFKNSHKGLCLSSFERFNPHICGYQQLPWLAAVDGVPVWTQSGKGASGIFGFGITNTHNPAVSQRGSLAVVSYAAPKDLTGLFGVLPMMFGHRVRLFWPLLKFDEHCIVTPVPTTGTGTFTSSPTTYFGDHVRNQADGMFKAYSWFVGRRDRCLIGVWCTQDTYLDNSHGDKDAELYVESPKSSVGPGESRTKPRAVDDAHSVDSKPMEKMGQTDDILFWNVPGEVPAVEKKEEPPLYYTPRRCCDEYRHSWIVVVGTIADNQDSTTAATSESGSPHVEVEFKSEYVSMEDFIHTRCLKMKAEERNGGSASPGSGVLSGWFGRTTPPKTIHTHQYCITVKDSGGEGTISYRTDIE